MWFALEKAFLRIYMQLFKVLSFLVPYRWPRTFSGAGATRELLAHMAKEQYRHVLLVTDKGLLELGLLEPLYEQAKALKIPLSTYDGILPDPTVAQIEEGVAKLKEVEADAVLAVGGGSVIDGAKLIAARALNNKPVIKMTGLFHVEKGMLPLYVVPTTAGTGSEVTIAAVVTDTEAQEKLAVIDHRIMPTAAALDGEIMKGLPPAITAATGMDALTHAVEAYLSHIPTATTDEQALAAAKLVFNNLERAVQQGDNLNVRQNMAKASNLAGMAFTRAGVGYIHAIAHNLGALYQLPHGLANAIVMPYVLQFSFEQAKHRMAKMARHCGLSQSANDEAAAQALIDKIIAMNEAFGFPKHPPQLEERHFEQIARNARAEARFTYAVPRYMNQEEAIELLRQIKG